MVSNRIPGHFYTVPLETEIYDAPSPEEYLWFLSGRSSHNSPGKLPAGNAPYSSVEKRILCALSIEPLSAWQLAQLDAAPQDSIKMRVYDINRKAGYNMISNENGKYKINPSGNS